MTEIGEIAKVLAHSKVIAVAGNGGSSYTASHFASDISKLGILAISFSENIATITAYTNDYGWDQVYTKQFEKLPIKPDAIVIFSVHGGVKREGEVWSGNLVALAEMAKQEGVTVISITGYDGGYLKEISDLNCNIKVFDTGKVEGLHSCIAHDIVEQIKILKKG
jgi:D-sedoheptulose 7-phosphate isomerase